MQVLKLRSSSARKSFPQPLPAFLSLPRIARETRRRINEATPSCTVTSSATLLVVEKVRADKNVNFGFNAATDEYGDLVKQGVIDPTKVTRTALQNAASIASLLLTTEAVIAELPEDKKKAGPPMPGGDMDY